MNAMLDDARQSLVANFGSIYVMTAKNDESGDIGPSLDDVERWLLEFNQAFIEANQVANEGRLHAYGGRRLVLVGDHLLPEFTRVSRLYEVTRQCGLAVTLSLSLEGVLNHALALATLRSAHAALQLQIDCSPLDTSPPERRAAYAVALRDLARTGSDLNLVGALEALRAEGLTSSEELNRGGFTVSAMARGGVRPVHRLHHVSPCRDFIALYVDWHGDVYPCAGMIGHEPSCLGSVNAPFADLLPALAQTRGSLDVLSPLGPRITPRVAEQIDHYPVDLCALHRLAVANLATL